MKDDRCFRLSLIRMAVCLLLGGLWAVRIEDSGAYLTDMQEKDNILVAADTKIHIDEEFIPPQDPAPGTWFVKEPRIVNDSASACRVRARICFSSLESETCCLPIEVNESWRPADDGFIYYTRLLEGGQTSDPLFSRVAFREDISEEDLQAALPFEIYVYAEAAACAGVEDGRVWTRMDGGEG